MRPVMTGQTSTIFGTGHSENEIGGEYDHCGS